MLFLGFTDLKKNNLTTNTKLLLTCSVKVLTKLVSEQCYVYMKDKETVLELPPSTK